MTRSSTTSSMTAFRMTYLFISDSRLSLSSPFHSTHHSNGLGLYAKARDWPSLHHPWTFSYGLCFAFPNKIRSRWNSCLSSRRSSETDKSMCHFRQSQSRALDFYAYVHSYPTKFQDRIRLPSHRWFHKPRQHDWCDEWKGEESV